MHWLKTKPIAHRGLHRGFSVPENSMKAFSRAIKRDYAIELDVRLTKDKKLVVFHDKNLIRVCASRKKIQNQTSQTLTKIQLYHSTQKIPLFTDVLKLIDGRVPVVVEIKNYGQVGRFEEEVVKALENYEGEFAVCSFNPNVVNWFRKNRPDFNRGLIYGDIKKFNIKFYKVVFLKYFFKCKPHFVSLDYKLLDTLIPVFCRRAKLPIVSWTINSKKKKLKARSIVDNIVFENIKP